MSISSREFYSEYSGHKVRHLERVQQALRSSTDRLLWTAGDSSLDNKYWFSATAQAIGPLAQVLQPPVSKTDVTHWLNEQCVVHSTNSNRNSSTTTASRPILRTAAINTAVEASTLNERTFKLRPQDVFLREKLQPDDVLIVSVGGNDVALMPSPCTIASMVGLMCCLPTCCLEHTFALPGFRAGLPADDCCCGCGASLGSCACACPPCAGYMHHLFGMRVQKYVEKLVAETKPSKVLICMIYYPDEYQHPGWASPILGALGYNRNPQKLQTLIRTTFEQAVSSIRIPGTRVIPVPLYHVLNGKVTSDYVQRVEPSPSGGRKMAEFLWNIVVEDDEILANGGDRTAGGTAYQHAASQQPTAPSTALIQERN